MAKMAVLLIALAVLCSGCAGRNEFVAANLTLEGYLIGFFLGVWHGLISPITLVGSAFLSDVGFYEIRNSGLTYDLGFILGVLWWGSSSTHVIYQYTTNPRLAGTRKEV